MEKLPKNKIKDVAKRRLFKEWATSIIGAMLCISALPLFFLNKIDFTNFWIMLGGGAALLGAKDKWLGIKGPAIILILLLISCNPSFNKSKSSFIEKGINKGYISEDSVNNNFNVSVDSSKDDKIINKAVSKIEKELNGKPINESNKEVVKKAIKNSLVPEIRQATYKDTIVTAEDGTKVDLKFTKEGIKVTVTHREFDVQKEGIPLWVWVVISALSLFNLFLLFALIMILTTNARR